MARRYISAVRKGKSNPEAQTVENPPAEETQCSRICRGYPAESWLCLASESSARGQDPKAKGDEIESSKSGKPELGTLLSARPREPHAGS